MSHDPRIPRATATAARKRADNCCEDCGNPDEPLELHHLRYVTAPGFRGLDDPGGESIYGHEADEDLVLLCRDCHHNRHLDCNGRAAPRRQRRRDDFWVDPEEMADAWFGYYHAMDKDD